MKVLKLLLIFCSVPLLAQADQLTWNTLADRADLWPGQCIMKATIPFQGGVTVNTGQMVNVDKFSAQDVEVTTMDGQTSFNAEPNEVDCLAAAQKIYDALTPKQQALSYNVLIGRRDLWPANIMLNEDIDFPGHHLSKGTLEQVMSVDNGSILVKSDVLKGTFRVFPSATNIMLQARTLVENPQAIDTFLTEQQKQAQVQAAAEQDFRENKLIYELKGKLINVATNQQQPLDSNALPKYFVFLRGSHSCPITHNFLPSVINFYNQQKSKHPEFEIVYVEYDTLGDASQFSKDAGFSSWRALAYDNTPPTPNSVIAGPLPQLFVMDRSGKLLINGIQSDAPRALQQLNDLLNGLVIN